MGGVMETEKGIWVLAKVKQLILSELVILFCCVEHVQGCVYVCMVMWIS